MIQPLSVERRVPLSAALAVALVAVAEPAFADDAGASGSLRWDPAWTHAGPADYALTIFGVEDAIIYEPTLQPHQPTMRWVRPILFDQAVRNLLRAASAETRKDAGTASWVLFGGVVAFPLVDVPYVWARYGPALAWDLFWQDATAISLATAVDLNMRDVIGRARPPVSACMAAGGSASQCLGSGEENSRSFPGGHVMIVTTAAALTCTQHLSMHLYGAPWDAVACATAIGADAAVGALRIVSDDHWATDIVAGYALGAAFGWGIPTLMHLHWGSGAAAEPRLHVVPIAMPVDRGAGLGATGWF